MKMCLKLAYCTLSSSPSKDVTGWVPFVVFLKFLLKVKLFDVFSLPRDMIANLSVFVARCVCVCVHPLNKDVSQAITGTFCQCHFQKIVVWVTFKFSLLLMLRFKSFKMWLPMSLNFIWLRIILALRVKGHSRGMCSFQITTSLKYITLFL